MFVLWFDETMFSIPDEVFTMCEAQGLSHDGVIARHPVLHEDGNVAGLTRLGSFSSGTSASLAIPDGLLSDGCSPVYHMHVESVPGVGMKSCTCSG